jgi:hypothetical protein
MRKRSGNLAEKSDPSAVTFVGVRKDVFFRRDKFVDVIQRIS